jgi:glycosyltransferase involved in cell wall biosynthesis
MLEGKLIICDSNIPWHHNRYSKHHLMSQLARSNEVVFVDPEEGAAAYLQRDRRQRGTLWRRYWQPAGEDLTVFTPLQFPGRLRLGFLQRWDEPYYVRQMRSVIRRHPGRDLILFIGNPWHVFLLDAFPEAACTVYHCSDNFPAMFAGDFRRRFEERERELIRRADLVVCSHATLVEKCRQYSDRVHYLEHAVDERFFRPEGEVPCPEDLAEIPRPRVGLVGSLDGGIDYDLLREAAQATADLSWVLIGPAKPEQAEEVQSLAALPNVWHLGPRPWERLPEYLWNLDVGVIPYRTSSFSQARSPLKLYEYLAAGMKVVTTNASAASEFSEHVQASQSGREFIDLTVRAASGAEADEGTGRAAARLRECHTWPHRAEELGRLVSESSRQAGGKGTAHA